MVQGSTYLLRIKPAVSLDIVSKIIFTFAKNNTVIIKKEYPGNVKITEDGNIGITLSQEDTLSLIGTVWIEAQYIFVNNSTGKTIRKPIYFRESQYTENVGNNDSENQSFGTYNIDMEDPFVVVITGGGSGEQGADGATFIPYVSEDGIISWTNDKNLENPDPVNIKGNDGASVESLSIEETGEFEETDPLTTESYVESKIYEHNTEPESHYDIRELITGLTNRLNALADSDDETLDQLSEIVAYIKSNKNLIDSITTGKVSVSDIVDNLTSSATNKPLSAAQGKALKALIDGITIPDKLPNPNALTFTGAVTGSYDGSTAVTVHVPSGGGSGGTVGYPVVSMTASTAELNPNTYYKWGNIASLTITLADPSDTGVTNEYCFEFVSGETATTLSVPDTVKWVKEPSVEAGKTYQVSILNGIGVICGA